MSSPGVAVLELVEEHRRKADVVEEFNAVEARMIRSIAEQYETVVKESIPEWWTLARVRQARPWSMRWLRTRCAKLVPVGRARKSSTGRWEMRFDAVLDLPKPPVRLAPIKIGDDLDALARQLAAED